MTPAQHLNAALDVLKNRYESELPEICSAIYAYRDALRAQSDAGVALSEDLSKAGSYVHNDQGDAWGRLGQVLRDISGKETTLGDALVSDVATRLQESVAADAKAFAARSREIRAQMAKYESELDSMAKQLARDVPKGTSLLVANANELIKQARQYDGYCAEMMRELQQSQQQQYINTFELWRAAPALAAQHHDELARMNAEMGAASLEVEDI